jgi:hypothetical protein
MIAIQIKATDEISIVQFDGDTLDAMQKAVGGYIEHTTPKNLPRPYCMIVNEEGLLNNLPVNNAGSLLYAGLVPIVGDVLILKDGIIEDGEPDIVSLDAEDVDGLMTLLCSRMAFLEPAG